jgi:hypothetical protein
MIGQLVSLVDTLSRGNLVSPQPQPPPQQQLQNKITVNKQSPQHLSKKQKVSFIEDEAIMPKPKSKVHVEPEEVEPEPEPEDDLSETESDIDLEIQDEIEELGLKKQPH